MSPSFTHTDAPSPVVALWGGSVLSHHLLQMKHSEACSSHMWAVRGSIYTWRGRHQSCALNCLFCFLLCIRPSPHLEKDGDPGSQRSHWLVDMMVNSPGAIYVCRLGVALRALAGVTDSDEGTGTDEVKNSSYKEQISISLQMRRWLNSAYLTVLRQERAFNATCLTETAKQRDGACKDICSYKIHSQRATGHQCIILHKALSKKAQAPGSIKGKIIFERQQHLCLEVFHYALKAVEVEEHSFIFWGSFSSLLQTILLKSFELFLFLLFWS